MHSKWTPAAQQEHPGESAMLFKEQGMLPQKKKKETGSKQKSKQVCTLPGIFLGKGIAA